MYKPSTYLEVAYFFTYLPIYETYFLHNWLPRWNPILTQLSNNGHPVDGALVGASSLLPYKPYQHLYRRARRLKPKEMGTNDCCTQTYLQ
jgi:hypothetical protein